MFGRNLETWLESFGRRVVLKQVRTVIPTSAVIIGERSPLDTSTFLKLHCDYDPDFLGPSTTLDRLGRLTPYLNLLT